MTYSHNDEAVFRRFSNDITIIQSHCGYSILLFFLLLYFIFFLFGYFQCIVAVAWEGWNKEGGNVKIRMIPGRDLSLGLFLLTSQPFQFIFLLLDPLFGQLEEIFIL